MTPLWRFAGEAWVAAAVVTLALALPCPVRSEAPGPRPYEVVTETDMPHLEENLRYAVRHERQCLDRHDLAGAFWMLQHASLKDCTLVKTGEDAGSASYRLQCDGGHGTTGDAQWRFEAAHLTGTLRVRLGGKNMTFYQRITATPVDAAPGC